MCSKDEQSIYLSLPRRCDVFVIGNVQQFRIFQKKFAEYEGKKHERIVLGVDTEWNSYLMRSRFAINILGIFFKFESILTNEFSEPLFFNCRLPIPFICLIWTACMRIRNSWTSLITSSFQSKLPKLVTNSPMISSNCEPGFQTVSGYIGQITCIALDDL